jgi:hypothetical protein
MLKVARCFIFLNKKSKTAGKSRDNVPLINSYWRVSDGVHLILNEWSIQNSRWKNLSQMNIL